MVDNPARLLFDIFASDILPVFLVACAGFLLARFAGINVRDLSRLSLYGLAPILMFHVLITSRISGDAFGRMALLCLMVTAAMGLLARLASIPLRLTRQERIALVLVVMFSNGGNYGLPVALFAFGREALVFATVYFVTSAVLTYTIGISLAASGRSSIQKAVSGVARIPAVYGVIAAGLMITSGAVVPPPVMKAVELLSDAALPVMMLVLGMQLERAATPKRPVAVAVAAGLSLLVSPAIAFGVAHALRLSGPALQAAVVQASMPTAVVTTIIALEFDVEPAFVTSVVVATTLISPFTLTLLIAYLQQAH
jgi:predicted permease